MEYGAAIQLDDEDIAHLRQVNPRVLDYVDELLGDAWLNPLRNDDVSGNCPFLRKGSAGYYCDIYKDRPDVCRRFPGKTAPSMCMVPIEDINVQ